MSSPQAAGRAWALLAVAFRYPRPDLHEAIRTGGFAADLSRELDELGLGDLPEVAELEKASMEMPESYEAYENAFIKAFDLADAKRGPSPYEASYSIGHLADVVLAVKQHYLEAGLNVGPEERPDHVAVELEFLAHLAGPYTDPADADRRREAEVRFLSSHLAHWMPAFAQRLGECPGMEVHAKLAILAGKLGTSRAAVPSGSPES